jgi:signal transduction histidine kinase
MSHGEILDELGISIATASPTLRERSFALAVALLILVGFGTLVPFANTQMPRLDSFIPTLEAIIAVTSIITAVLLFGQFLFVWSFGLLLLGGAYLFTALILIPHILTFPGAFAPLTFLRAGSQSAAWLYIFWHLGFSGAAAVYVFLRDTKVAKGPSVSRLLFYTVTVTVTVVCALTWSVTGDTQLMPPLFRDEVTFAPLASYATGADLLLGVLAFVFLWKWGRSKLDVWLVVMLMTFILELSINTWIISGRFTVGWYFSRGLSVLVSAIVLIVLLRDTLVLDTTLARMSMLLQHERNNKLARLEVVVGAIAHEVRQPLTGIVAQASAARRWLDATPPNLSKAKMSLERIDSASMRVSDVFGTIRGLFINSDAEKQSLDINGLVLHALQLSREELKAHSIQVKLQQTRDLPRIFGHESQLQEVILNLVQNAIDAMSSVSDRPRILLVGTHRHGQDAIGISVEDTGPGIDPEKVSTIFEKLVSTKVKGMGLGLAICKSIVESHHGQIAVSSGIAGGARFQVTIPIEPLDELVA